jgi:hypothetical protein
VASGAKALTEKKGPIAALEALRHPKANFSPTYYLQPIRRVTDGWLWRMSVKDLVSSTRNGFRLR